MLYNHVWWDAWDGVGTTHLWRRLHFTLVLKQHILYIRVCIWQLLLSPFPTQTFKNHRTWSLKHLLDLTELTNWNLRSGRHSIMSEICYVFLFVTNSLLAKGKNLVGKSLCFFLSPWAFDGLFLECWRQWKQHTHSNYLIYCKCHSMVWQRK